MMRGMMILSSFLVRPVVLGLTSAGHGRTRMIWEMQRLAERMPKSADYGGGWFAVAFL